MRVSILLLSFLLTALGFAQQPLVQTGVDFRPMLRMARDGEGIVRLYDDSGHISTVHLTLLTEVGFRVYIAQRLQRIANDSDNELLNEYYIEDTNYWRVGKQLLPFGLAMLEREYVRAGRVNTTLALGGYPISVAYCDGGTLHPKGFVARIGREYGVSVAAGENFGISGTSLNDIRLPEEAPPIGGGYRLLIGADYMRKSGDWTLAMEWLRARDGHRVEDKDNDYSLAKLQYDLPFGRKASFAWARSFENREDNYRLRLDAPIAGNVNFIPQVRWQGGRLLESSIGLQIRY